MASAKLQKPGNETCSHVHEEHKFSQKISEMTAWGSRVFGHKQQEQQAVAKHCTTCQCPAPKKDIKPACTETHKKEHVTTVSVNDTKSNARRETKKKEKDEHTSGVHKDGKHSTCIELKKKEKQHATNVRAKDSKQPACAEMKKEKKQQHGKGNTTNACNTMIKKEHKDEPSNHCFSSMADHWKEKIMMMTKPKDGKCKDSSSSSSSDNDREDEASEKKKVKDKKHSQETKTTSK